MVLRARRRPQGVVEGAVPQVPDDSRHRGPRAYLHKHFAK